MWKSVRGLSLQEGALLSALLRLVWFGCGLVEPLAEAGTSLKICKSRTQPLSAHADMPVHVSFCPKRANYGHEGLLKSPSPFPSVFFFFFSSAEKQTAVDQRAALGLSTYGAGEAVKLVCFISSRQKKSVIHMYNGRPG